MNPIYFYPDAESEMIDAAAWYETQQINLGKRFLASVQDAINRVKLHPHLYPFVESDVRRCLIKTFPFGILLKSAGETVYQRRDERLLTFDQKKNRENNISLSLTFIFSENSLR